jgi:hypothetical protein
MVASKISGTEANTILQQAGWSLLMHEDMQAPYTQ